LLFLSFSKEEITGLFFVEIWLIVAVFAVDSVVAVEKVDEVAAKEDAVVEEDVAAVDVVVVAEDPDAVEKTKRNGFQLRNSAVW